MNREMNGARGNKNADSNKCMQKERSFSYIDDSQ